MIELCFVATVLLRADAASVLAALPVPDGAQSVERATTSAGGTPVLRFSFVARGEREAVPAFYERHLRESGWRACSGGSAGKWYRGADSMQGPARPFEGRTAYWLAADAETVLAVTLLVWDDANAGEHTGENQEARITAIGPKETAAMVVREYGLRCGR
ncbi:MAG TPA: hypothetical protein VF139_07815 [Candidatus Polarisedimenticolaceae bacterium]